MGSPSASTRFPGQVAEKSNVKANTVGEQEHRSVSGICALAPDISTANVKIAAVCRMPITDKPREALLELPRDISDLSLLNFFSGAAIAAFGDLS